MLDEEISCQGGLHSENERTERMHEKGLAGKGNMGGSARTTWQRIKINTSVAYSLKYDSRRRNDVDEDAQPEIDGTSFLNGGSLNHSRDIFHSYDSVWRS